LKLWKPDSLPSLSLWGCLKVFLFNVFWMLLCLVGAVVILLKYILSFGRSDISRDIYYWVETPISQFCTTLLVGHVQVVWKENLPADIAEAKPAPIFVANHCSQIDIGIAYFIKHRFKWISKKSVLYLPGVNAVMYFGGHVLIDRRTGKNKESVTNFFDKSNESVQSGIPVFIFPQGTRWIAEKLPFKNGAFVVAQTNRSPLIPLSFDIPRNAWNSFYPLNVLWGGKPPIITITIHKAIPVTGNEDIESLKQQCMNQIYSVIPEVVEKERKKKE